MTATPETLVIVCCHAIYLGSEGHEETPHDESSWLIEPFQTGEVPTFIAHIKAGLDALKKEEEKKKDSAILCFSGGPTKPSRTQRSEAEGYAQAARELDPGLVDKYQDQIFCDNWATDSFQNILCSLIQWPEWVKKKQKQKNPTVSSSSPSSSDSGSRTSWPRKLVIVSHAFKRRRFLELHLPALRWKREVEYIGIDPFFTDDADGGQARMAEIVQGDLVRGYGVWKNDLYGQATKVLREKREKRGWVEEDFVNSVVVGTTTDTTDGVLLKDLLRWKGGEDGITVFPRALPWEK